MQTCEELELFPLTETEKLRVEIAKLHRELSNLRKGLFSRHDNLFKMYIETKEEIDSLKKMWPIMDKEIHESTNAQKILPFP